jgi:hypothetical protein
VQVQALNAFNIIKQLDDINSKVYLVQKKDAPDTFYALKVVRKDKVLDDGTL